MNLHGKRVLFLGSSITYGYASGGVSFADIMAERCGLFCLKEAVSGTTLADVEEKSYVARLKKIPADTKVDLFVCQLSSNDSAKGVAPAETEAGIRFIVEYVRRVFGCPVVFYTSPRYKKEQYGDLVRDLLRLAEEYGFYVIDLWNDPEMSAVSEEDRKRYMKDSVHPTLEGYRDWWTPKFISFCEALPE